MELPILAILVGLIVLVWSADRFVEGAAAVAQHLGMSPLLIGMLIVGFGTSAPEIVISTLSALDNRSGLALGNALGSNIANIALILGVTAILMPIAVQSRIIKIELPILMAATGLLAYTLYDHYFSRADGYLLLCVFAMVLAWTIWQGTKQKATDALGDEVLQELESHPMSLGKGVFWLIAGLGLMIASSRGLVWGAVQIAQMLGVSDIIIGLTIVAVGTSLPELATSISAALKKEPDLVLGGVIGSNLFNTLAVTGIAGSIAPAAVSPDIFPRDVTLLLALTAVLFVLCWGWRGKVACIKRWEGTLLLLAYVGYTGYLVYSALL